MQAGGRSGNDRAQCYLGVCATRPDAVCRRTTRRLSDVRWRRSDNADAQYNLGVCYNTGRGVPVDDKEAARLYKLAADQGHALAQYNLGGCYNTGRGVPQDDNEAARLYKLAADQGHAQAQQRLVPRKRSFCGSGLQ